MKAVILVMALLMLTGISSCQTPGLEEPDIFICTITLNEQNTQLIGDCEHSLTQEHVVLDQFKLIGFQAVSPKGFAKIKTHHEVLHKELNEDKK